MTVPDTCPDCGSTLGGLGKCWGEGCSYDHRTDGRRVASEEAGESKPAPRQPDEPLEKQVQTAIKKALGQVADDRLFICDTSQALHAQITPGLPDLILIVEGAGVFWREVKRPSGRQTEAQRAFQARLKAAGEDYATWRSATDAVRWWSEIPSRP